MSASRAANLPPRLSPLETIGGIGVGRARSKMILSLAWPVVLGMLTQTAVNLVDSAMVGHLPDRVAIPGQAALNVAIVLFWAIGGFLSSIQVGAQAIVARRYGEGEKLLAGRALANATTIAFTTAIVVSIAAYLIVPFVFGFFHKDPEVNRWGISYLQIRMIGLLSMVATQGCKGFFDGIGRTYVHMVAAIIMNVINIFGNWLLIYGNLGFPRLEVDGAAIASTISTYIGLFIILGWTFTAEIRKNYRPFRLGNFDLRVIWDIVRLSVPSGIATVAMMTGFLLFQKIVGDIDDSAGHGAIYGAATKVIIDILSVTFMSCIAVGTATATLVGQSLGRGKPRRAELFGWDSVKLGFYLFGAFGLTIALWPGLFIQIFNPNPEIIAAASPPLRLMGSCGGLIAAGLILMQAMFGAGNAKFVMWVELGLHFLVLVPLAWVFGVLLEGELLGMWMSGVVYVSLLVLVMGYTFYRGRWKTIRV
ncbi:MAG: MATE family efflux transporter [Deltaproteobacteria bacterium]|nr:MATE family efflux transporter [Deltaproteobacteria bacterium]